MENDDCYVVGIGASAGGNEALFELFSALPADLNAAYVVVRHLKRDAPTVMQQLLQRYTPMEVITVNGGEVVTRGKVYLLPENRKLIIRRRSLYLRSRPSSEIINTAIDTFFITLGEEVGSKAIGIILSGTGTDGVRGVKAIEDNGGIVIVQDPATAKYPQLPENTIHLDHPDHVLPLHEMPWRIRKHIQQPSGRVAGAGS